MVLKKNTMFDGKRSLNKLLMFKKAKIDVEKTICDWNNYTWWLNIYISLKKTQTHDG